MIKVSILYPYRENGRFDMDYYCGTHMPLAAKLFGAALKGWSVDAGINAGPPGVGTPLWARRRVYQFAYCELARPRPGHAAMSYTVTLISLIRIEPLPPSV